MERRLIRPWERLVRGKAAVLARVGRHDPERRAWRPGNASWSLEDVVEHLVLVEGQMRTALAREPTPERPRVVRPGQRLRWLGLRIVLKVGIRIRAPVDSILPGRQMPWDVLLDRWEADRLAWAAWLRDSDPVIHPMPRFRHPIVGWLTVPEAVTFAADHLEHHLGQIRRIESGLGQGAL